MVHAYRDFQSLIVGGGSAGLAVASTLSETLGKNSVAVVEPADVHYVSEKKRKSKRVIDIQEVNKRQEQE